MVQPFLSHGASQNIKKRALNERSLMALVEGMTIMSLVRVHTLPSKHF